ncbi:gag-protease polyprotein [Cucumis melo var. makuwa]|uniref:Gag-protease polyprotein n=1 Tax=Cucumis melo var. makuwa TaxID=1194695 RepID=A0A5A7UR30_CUCMM|nr:gag-protease polyprotein [Cucumis melo var. makuwa]
MIVEQHDAEFDILSRFALEATKTDKFVSSLRLDLQGKWSTSGQKKKVDQQLADITLRDSSPGGTFRRHQQEVTELGGPRGSCLLVVSVGKIMRVVV